MTILILIFLAIVQGLTEFLPVSSSGHLALLEGIFHLNETQKLSYTAFLHLGTILTLIFFFRKKIYSILSNLFKLKDKEQNQESVSLILKIIIGTIPAAIVGFFAKDKIDLIFNKPIYSGVFLIITGFILYITKFSRETKSKVTYSDAFIIGIAQAVALLPGISRSGATIAIALLLGLSRTDGFEFSFLLSIPAVIGANILMFKDISMNFDITSLILAVAIPFVFGLLALKLLRNFVLKKQLHYFSYYCWVIGFIAILIILAK